MFENNLRTKLEPYLMKSNLDFDPNLLPDLSRRKFFQRDKIFEYLRIFNLSSSQLQLFLSINYERILLGRSSKKEEIFLKCFEKDLTKFSKDRAVIACLLYSYFEDSKKIFELLSKLEEVKIEQGSVEAFDLVSRYIESILINGFAHKSAKNAKMSLESVKILSQFLEVQLNSFSGFFEEISEKFKKENHINSAKVIADFANNL